MKQSTQRVRLVLDLDLSGQCLSGTVTAPRQPDLRFTGWLGLLSALEGQVERLRGPVPAIDGTNNATKGGQS